MHVLDHKKMMLLFMLTSHINYKYIFMIMIYGVSYFSFRQRVTYKEIIILLLRWDVMKGMVSSALIKKRLQNICNIKFQSRQNILVAVKLATFGEKGWESDRKGTLR